MAARFPSGSDNEEVSEKDVPDEKPGPDDTDDVKKETEIVFRDFMYRRLVSRHGFEEHDMTVTNIPRLDNLDDLKDNNDDSEYKLSNEQQEQLEHLGKTLADFGDIVQDRYKPVFNTMIASMPFGDDADCSFDVFCSIARKLFQNGISWGRIVALLCFGYQIAVNVIKSGSRGIINFLKKIIQYVIEFIIKENIISWIKEQGGWLVGFVGSMADPNENSSEIWMQRIGAVAVIAAICYGCYRCYGRSS